MVQPAWLEASENHSRPAFQRPGQHCWAGLLLHRNSVCTGICVCSSHDVLPRTLTQCKLDLPAELLTSCRLRRARTSGVCMFCMCRGVEAFSTEALSTCSACTEALSCCAGYGQPPLPHQLRPLLLCRLWAATPTPPATPSPAVQAMGSYPYPTSYMLNGHGELPAYPMRAACQPLGAADLPAGAQHG